MELVTLILDIKVIPETKFDIYSISIICGVSNTTDVEQYRKVVLGL